MTIEIATSNQQATLPALTGLQRSAITYMDAMIADQQIETFDLYSHVDYMAGGCAVFEEAARLAGESGVVSLRELRIFIEGEKK